MTIAFLTQRLPYAPNRGDRVRAYHEIRALAARHEVHVVSLVHDEDEAAHARDLDNVVSSVTTIPVTRVRNRIRGAASLATRRPLTHVLLDGPSARAALDRLVARARPDLVFAFCSSMARFAMEPPLDGLPFVLDMVDVDSAKWAALAERGAAWKRWILRREARLLGPFEARAARAARAVWVVNDREAGLLAALAGPGVRVLTVQNGVDLAHYRPAGPPPETGDVVFCGVMDYAPNEQAAIWLATEVWPIVRAARPSARLVLVGSSPTSRVRALAGDPSVVVTGTVPDVRPYLWDGAVSAAPLHVARGVQNKVLEAAAAGLPAVVTTAVAGGLPRAVLPACEVADEPGEFADRLLRLLALSPGQRRARAASAAMGDMTWESRLAPMLAAIDALTPARGSR
jgi:polysaccharide biosynthesis protein PslH